MFQHKTKVCVCTCTCTCVCLSAHLYICACARACAKICVCTCACVRACACMSAPLHMCTCLCLFLCLCPCLRACACVYARACDDAEHAWKGTPRKVEAKTKERGGLLHLDLSGNILGDKGTRALCSGLFKNRRLQTLIVSHNLIRNEGAKVYVQIDSHVENYLCSGVFLHIKKTWI